MKRLLCIVFSHFAINSAVCQVNLVPNPSFEEYTSCPDNTNMVDSVISWKNYGNTPDYFNACSTDLVGVPLNAIGYQQAASGQAYCGLVCHEFIPNAREFIGTELNSDLEAGTKYYISMRINFSNSPIYYNCIAINKLGVKFSNTAYSEFLPAPVDNISHVYSDSIITDTLGWYRVFGSFTPSTSYQYLIIGNFFDDNQTDTINACNMNLRNYSYVDDVCVSIDSVFTLNYIYTGIKDKEENNKLLIYPNPSLGIFTISSNELISEYIIYNLLGETIFKDKTDKKKLQIDLSNYAKGSYFIHIKTNQTIINKQIIIN